MAESSAARRYLSWPPPGLEPLHGKVWPIIALMAIGDVILLLPLLAAVGAERDFTSPGPLGDQWWILLLTTATGLVVLTAALEGLVRLAWRAGRSVHSGHGWRTVVYVAADESRDHGFLLQGARHFASLAPGSRRLVLSLRLASTGLLLAAVVMAPAGLLIGVVLGRAGWFESEGLWLLSAYLPALVALGGGIAGLAGHLLARSARGDAAARAARDAALRGEIAEWNERSRELIGAEGPDLAAPGLGASFRAVSVGLAVAGVLSLAMFALLTAAGSIGPVLGAISYPSFGRTQSRLLEAELYRPYAAPQDPNVGAREAGEALHALALAGRNEPVRYMREPVRRYERALRSIDTLAGGSWFSPARILESFATRGRDLTAPEREWIRSLSTHPALAEFPVVASAPDLDIVGARYTLPFGDSVNAFVLPIPPYGQLRGAARARLAVALLDLAEGRTAQAEQGIGTVISVGFALLDHGTMLIDALTGAMIVREAGDALGNLYRATGRAREADELGRMREQIGLAGRTRTAVRGTSEGALRARQDLVLDSTVVRAMRWENFFSVQAFSPCNNLHSIVFGPGEEYAAWLDQARASLVRRESDAALFDLVSRGFFGTEGCPVFRIFRDLY